MKVRNQTRVDLHTGSTVTVTQKTNAFNLFIEPENHLWTYDLEGRLLGAYYHSKNYRRTLDNNFYLKTRGSERGEVFRNVEKISRQLSERLINAGIETAAHVLTKVAREYHLLLKKIIANDFKVLERSGDIFRSIYLPISILPPDQYLSLVIQITEGCNYNKCTFCDFYRDRPFRLKKFDEIQNHIVEIKQFFGKGLSLRRSIFLADANALVTPVPKLVEALDMIRNSYPEIPAIYSFIDIFTGIKKTRADFELLKSRGVSRVYLGIESGNRGLLEFLNKPQDSEEIIKLTRELKDAGIGLGVILLAGAGGMQFAPQHLSDSVSLVEKLPLGLGDMVYVSEFYETNQEYRKAMVSGKIPFPDRLQIRYWANELKQALKAAVGKDVKVAVYDIKQFFY